MAGTVSKDNAVGDGSSPSEGTSVGQNCQAGDLLAEWRSCEQVENDTPSTSPPYWDTDDEDDNGPKPSELYGKFTWKIDNFSQISKRELRSNVFEVGGYKWYILIYPQGCDVCNHLSLFLCVANHDRLLPGWSHFAQFTIAVVNKDPKKSKYSDTLHRFWKKEHDWGWKKFMELSKIADGFIDADTLVIKAQVQVIREKANHPFRCLDRQYRRELVRVYLSNVENICRRFIEERRGMLSKLIEDRVSWSGFRLFWLGIDQSSRRRMSRDKTEAILKVIVKHFFVEKEVTSTLVMDSLYSGLKALEWQSGNKRGTNKSADIDEMPAPIVDVENSMFILADDALVLLERTALEPLPPKDDKGSQSQSQSQNQNRTKDGSSTEEFSKDSVERDEKRLTELGRRTLEIFVLTHIFSSKIEVAYQEVVAFQRQEELIREEEAAGQAEIELRAKRLAAEKEKRAKKKQSKQKRNNRKGKDKSLPTKANLISADVSLKGNSHDEKILEDFSAKSEETISEKLDIVEDASDVSDTGAEVALSVDPGLDDRVASPRNWETDVSEVNPGAEASSSELQNDQLGKKGRVDDSSSTCSTDSVPSVVLNTGNRANLSQNNKDIVPPNSRGRNRRTKAARRRTSQTSRDTVTLPSDATLDGGHLQDATDHSRTSTPEREAILPSNDQAQLPEPDLPDKREESPFLQDKPQAKDLATESTQPQPQPRKVDSSLSPVPLKSASTSSQQLKQSSEEDSAESVSARESTADVERQVERMTPVILKPRQNMNIDKPENQKLRTSGKVMNATEASPLSRPLSAPLIPEAKPTAPLVSTVQTSPFLSRSVSAFGRLGATEAPSSSQSYAPLSYRNAIIGKSTSWSNSSRYAPDPSSSSRGSLYSQPAASVVTASCTDSVLSGPEQFSMRPGLTFGSVAPKPSVSGNRAPAGRLVQESGRNMHTPGFARDAGLYTEELVSGQAVRQVQGNTADEFPHLDIINYVLDEDYMDAKMSASGRTCLLPTWQYGFPGNLAGADAGPSNSSCHFNGPDQYYSDTNGMYDSYHLLDGGRDLLSPDVDSPAYTSREMDGWMLSQWHLGAAGNSVLNVGGSVECNPHPYQLQDYSNLACGVSGYTMYPPANGF